MRSQKVKVPMFNIISGEKKTLQEELSFISDLNCGEYKKATYHEHGDGL